MNKIWKFKLDCNVVTNYRVAKILCVHQTAVANWEKDDSKMTRAIQNLIMYVTEYYDETGEFLEL